MFPKNHDMKIQNLENCLKSNGSFCTTDISFSDCFVLTAKTLKMH